MPHIRVAQQAAPVVPMRPVLPIHRMRVRHSVKQHRPVAPRILPILQAPTFSNQSDFIFETKGEQNQDDIKYTNNPSLTKDPQRTKKTTQQITIKTPAFILQQNYPKQPLPNLTNQPIRHAELKYPSHLHSSQ